MDAELVVQLMVSQQLICEDIVMTAQSLYHKNCLVLEQIRLMSAQSLKSFCELLKTTDSQKSIGDTLLTGK